jgi:hypothetical protein
MGGSIPGEGVSDHGLPWSAEGFADLVSGLVDPASPLGNPGRIEAEVGHRDRDGCNRIAGSVGDGSADGAHVGTILRDVHRVAAVLCFKDLVHELLRTGDRIRSCLLQRTRQDLLQRVPRERRQDGFAARAGMQGARRTNRIEGAHGMDRVNAFDLDDLDVAVEHAEMNGFAGSFSQLPQMWHGGVPQGTG